MGVGLDREDGVKQRQQAQLAGSFGRESSVRVGMLIHATPQVVGLVVGRSQLVIRGESVHWGIDVRHALLHSLNDVLAGGGDTE